VAAPGERRDAAAALFRALDEVCRPGAVLATTAAAVPVIECAMATGRPGDVVGMHLNGELAQLVHTVRSSPEALATARAVAAGAGLTAVVCRDTAGAIVNALLVPYLNDAVRMVEAGYASVDDIDAAMTRGCGYPAGPFATLDAAGLDRLLAVQRAIYRERREPGVSPAPLWRQMATAFSGSSAEWGSRAG
jgi:3-hydroxybutyryl-CoA dehydrogenase